MKLKANVAFLAGCQPSDSSAPVITRRRSHSYQRGGKAERHVLNHAFPTRDDRRIMMNPPIALLFDTQVQRRIRGGSEGIG